VVTQTETTFSLVGTPFLEYHPVVDLSSGRLLGMEALVRWLHPTEGRISPDRLIPEAEASGDIGPLTRWIVLEACEQACRWSPSIQLGVNCQVQQLRRGEVSKAVSDALERTGFRSGQLTLEVTEDAVVDPDASADLRALSEMGVQLSVDDVGTNWSSFEPFKRHSISTLKIDGSFIKGLEHDEGINRLVVETVIHMAHSLGMSAIVEQVENASQVEIVRSFKADAAQGFFFARPMSSEDAAEFASGAEIAQFSLSATTTLMKPHGGPDTLTVVEREVAPEPVLADEAEPEAAHEASEVDAPAAGADGSSTEVELADGAEVDSAEVDSAEVDEVIEVDATADDGQPRTGAADSAEEPSADGSDSSE
jgi:EAL domain-containing protein (putative c-di-GMP-specific phosphodiesterase class I)